MFLSESLDGEAKIKESSLSHPANSIRNDVLSVSGRLIVKIKQDNNNGMEIFIFIK